MPDNSANRELPGPKPSTKHPRNLPLLSLNIPPHDETSEVAAPSQLPFIQCRTGGFQNTSLTILILEGFILQLNAFRIENSLIDELASRQLRITYRGRNTRDNEK